MNSSTEPTDRIPVGRIGRPHGLRGEVTILPESDAAERFAPGSSLATETGRHLVVAASRPYRDRGLIVAFEGVVDRSAAEALRDVIVTISAAERRPLEEGEYWIDDLVGLRVIDPGGRMVGTVTDVVLGPQDRLVVDVGTGEIEVPFVHDLVGDPHDGTITVDLPVGLEVRERRTP